MKKVITILCLFLITIPLSAKAFNLDEFLKELEKLISEENGNNSQTPLDDEDYLTGQVINKVEVHTNTGETTINGEVKEGETKTKVEVKNIINGEEIEPIEIEAEANEVKVESEVRIEDGELSVKKEIEIDSETETENYQTNLEDTKNEETSTGNLEKIRNWWSNFVDSLMASLQNIFNRLGI